MYGVKRGIKAPGEFGIMDMSGLALSGAAGIIAAIIADYQQKGEAAALFKINTWVVQFGGMLGFTEIPLWMVVVGLVTVGAGSVFYFQPITRQGAFAQGFGLLAVLLTMTPPNLASGIEGMSDNLPGLSSIAARDVSIEPRIVNAAYEQRDARVFLAQNEEEAEAKYDVRLKVTYPEGIRGDIRKLVRQGAMRGRLHNEETGETYNLFRATEGAMITREGDTLTFNVGVPARSDTARLWIRIETVGYTIEERSAEATLAAPLEWEVEMQPSNIPLQLQRFGRSYWF